MKGFISIAHLGYAYLYRSLGRFQMLGLISVAVTLVLAIAPLVMVAAQIVSYFLLNCHLEHISGCGPHQGIQKPFVTFIANTPS